MKRLLLLCIVGFMSFSGLAFASENSTAAEQIKTAKSDMPYYILGGLKVSYQFGHVSGNKAKANEYTYRGDGPSGYLWADWGKDNYQWRFDGQFAGYTDNNHTTGFKRFEFDVSTRLNKINHYKVQAYAQQFNHHLSDGRSNKLHSPDSPIYMRGMAVSDFTYHRQRTNVGIEAEASYESPLFASIKLDSQHIEGVLPFYHVDARSNGNLPCPVDYYVNTLSGQMGYRSSNFTLAFDGSVDSLSNDQKTYRQNLTDAGNIRFGAPESKSYKVGGAMTWRMTEINSTLMLNGSYSNLTSDTIESSRTYENSPAAYRFWDTFKGDIKNTTVNAAFTTKPFQGFTGKVYTRYFDRKNDSKVTRNPNNPTAGNDLLRELARDRMGLFEYDKFLVGTEITQRIAKDYQLTGGYEFETTQRNRYALTQVKHTDDNKIWLGIKAPVSDMVDTRLSYQYLHRDSSKNKEFGVPVDSAFGGVIVVGPSSGLIAPWFSYADSASKNQHQIKAGLDINPAEDLSLSLGYIFTLDDFTKKQPLGLNDRKKHEIIADLSYAIGPVNFNLYGGLEFAATKMDTRSFTLDTANPGNPVNIAGHSYNWGYEQKDITYSFGASGKMDIMKDCLDLTVSYDFTKNDGKTKLGYPHDPAGIINRGNIAAVNDYTQQNLTAEMKYHFTEQKTLAFGYAYSKLDYKDWAYTGLQNDSMMWDGYYNVSPSYEAHTVSATFSYQF